MNDNDYHFLPRVLSSLAPREDAGGAGRRIPPIRGGPRRSETIKLIVAIVGVSLVVAFVWASAAMYWGHLAGIVR